MRVDQFVGYLFVLEDDGLLGRVELLEDLSAPEYCHFQFHQNLEKQHSLKFFKFILE